MALVAPNVHTWETFVSPTMNVSPKTREIIEAIMPYFPKGCRCITGYQDEEVQYWKVNYHWEYALFMIDKALAKLRVNSWSDGGRPWKLSVNPWSDAGRRWAAPRLAFNAPDHYAGQLKLIREQLMMNAPRPQTGYRLSKVEGQPKDLSARDQIVRRWESLRLAKRELKFMSPKLSSIAPPAQAWKLAAAVVAKPGKSNHGKGWALDIEGAGLNQQIADITLALGGKVLDEDSHVHVEFPNGVKPPR